MVRTLLVCGLLVMFSGCAREGPLSFDPAIATRQMNSLVPKGTSKAQATKRLQERGFQFSRLDSHPTADHLLIATFSKGKHTWLVGLVIINERVVACSVTISESS